MGKLKKIEMDDITKYRIPSNPVFNPAGNVLAFQVTSSNVDKNEYKTDVWLYRKGEEKAFQATYSISANIVLWADDENIILTRSTKDDVPGTTTLYKLNINGGEARPWLTLPFAMGSLKKISDSKFAALGMMVFSRG